MCEFFDIMCEFKHTHMMRVGRVETSVSIFMNPVDTPPRPRPLCAVRRPLTSSLSTSRLGSCNPSCRRACSCTRAGTRGCCKRRHPCPRCGSCGSDTPCVGGGCGGRGMSAWDVRGWRMRGTVDERVGCAWVGGGCGGRAMRSWDARGWRRKSEGRSLCVPRFVTRSRSRAGVQRTRSSPGSPPRRPPPRWWGRSPPRHRSSAVDRRSSQPLGRQWG